MIIQPIPQKKLAEQSGFTLIELLVVIAIIALLASVTVPIYSMVNAGTNSSRSLANLKNIGSALSIYASENNNHLPAVESVEPLNWTNVDIDLEDEELEKLPHWTQSLIHLGAKSGSDLSRRVFSCPGLRWKDDSGDKVSADSILLAYGVTEAMNGFDEGNDLTPEVPRALASIENKPNTIMIIETKQDGSSLTSFPQATWREAKRDFGRQKASESTVVDFRFKKAVNALMADGSARGFRFKDKQDIEEPHWTGEDFDSIR